MKNISVNLELIIQRLFVIGLFLTAFPVFLRAQVSDGAQPVFEEALQYDFGDIVEGSDASKTFHFVNKGTQSLLFGTINTTCSCTASEYPKEGVQPGDSAYIKVVFDSKGKKGFYAQGVNLSYNGGEVNIVIYANVIPKE